MKQPMKDRVERFVVLPFGIGCTSESSVAVGSSSNQQSKKPKSEPKAYSETTGSERAKSVPNGDHHNHDQRPRSSLPNFLYGLQKLVAGSFKSFSQIFVYRDELKEVEIEMQIGFPTDVKHVTHIGLDGSTMTNPVKGWDNLAMSMAPEILTFPSLSLRQFELAMAAQSAPDDHINAPRPVTVDPAKFSRNTTARSS